MDSIVLGGIVKRLYPNFNMVSFSNRLKIQKMIFLMKSFNLDLGYSFSLYLHGPYCTDLTRDAYLIDDWKNIPLIEFQDQNQEKTFNNFLNQIEKYKNNEDWLEIASTLLMLNQISNLNIVNRCKEIKSQFDDNYIKDVLNDMKKGGFL